ncbi:angiotensin-converting enzyme 2 [Eurytemora carolleeae]|uniref:angiotensin-converting enzyme 2 n=1 Tax=Eurytemora carolleeae TaxID=1294199 RepID=UPI000C7939F8|nr:angiotensin-converting enzyme 2 [Eurytemora carolleeae]|eukprot:XP_023320479.1 angiotensin-converting enzyme 2-like [Eurytemora affinis]
MIRYFVRTLLQFQFLESLCQESGHTGPLHRCDFSGSVAAGAKLTEMLNLGASVPWPKALKKLTGTEKMSTKPILEFFQPLQEWLKEENMKNGDRVGWN